MNKTYLKRIKLPSLALYSDEAILKEFLGKIWKHSVGGSLWAREANGETQ